MTSLKNPDVVCMECKTELGGNTGKDAYKHLLHCLHVEPDSLGRMREQYERAGGEHARRVLHIVDSLIVRESRHHGEQPSDYVGGE